MKRWYLFYFDEVTNRHPLSDEFAIIGEFIETVEVEK